MTQENLFTTDPHLELEQLEDAYADALGDDCDASDLTILFERIKEIRRTLQPIAC